MAKQNHQNKFSNRLLIVLLNQDSVRRFSSRFKNFVRPIQEIDNAQTLIVHFNTEVQSEPPLGEKTYQGLFHEIYLNNSSIGQGGALKAAFQYALENEFDAVLPVYNIRSYDEQALPRLLSLWQNDPQADCIIGRCNRRGFRALLSLPFSIGIALVNFLQNWLTRSPHIRSWQSPYKIFRTNALKNVGFELNTNQSHFDTEVLLQLVNKGYLIQSAAFSLSGNNWITLSLRHLLNCLKASLKYRLGEVHLFYDIRYELDTKLVSASSKSGRPYHPKLDSMSPHRLVCQIPHLVPSNSKVLDVGCSTGYVGEKLFETLRCEMTGIDILPPEDFKAKGFARYHQIDLENNLDEFNKIVDGGEFDVVLMLDILEHLSSPERFLINLYKRKGPSKANFVISTGNVAFFAVRLLLLCGFFNYGRKGILDITHKRLFSLRSFRNLLEQTGFIVEKSYFLPFPFLALGFPPKLSRFLEMVNRGLIAISPSLFSYQMMVSARQLPSIDIKT